MRINYENPREQVGSFDQKGKRVYAYPARVRGWFRTRRTWVEALLILVFVGLPIVQVGGHPAVFLDVSRREFFLFGAKFWATDAPKLFFILGTFFILLMAMTSLWGRVWCGWACPQTVFIDGVYRRIEEWLEGDSRKRRLLDEAPWSGRKIALRGTKWTIFAAVSVGLSHAFLAYFVSWHGWGERYASGFDGALGSLFAVIFISVLLIINFGIFREQFCVFACPYGRWQAVWMDERSMTVEYSAWRGEPRRGLVGFGEKQGDCVNCYRCVQSCPTGIDIRRGIQLECIGCTACADACDEVMTALGKPKGLIRYASLFQNRDPQLREKPFRIIWRLRPILYLTAVAISLVTLVSVLFFRDPLFIAILRPAGPPFLSSQLPDGSTETLNTFKITVRNQWSESARVVLRTEPGLGLQLSTEDRAETLQSGEQRDLLVMIKFRSPKGTSVSAPRDFDLEFTGTGLESGRGFSMSRPTRFISR